MVGLDEETRALMARTLERFVADHYDPAVRLARLKAPHVDYRLHWALLTELGLPGLALSADRGGLGGGAVDLGRAFQILGHGLVLEPVAEALIGNALLASAFPADSAALEQALAGERVVIAPNLAPGCSLRISGSGAAVRISGHLRAVPHAAQADEWLLAARTTDGQERLLRLGTAGLNTPGVRMQTFRLLDGRPAADLHFDEAALPPDALCGDAAAGTATLARGRELWLTAQCADAVGVMAHALALTRDYLRTRIQFGVALATFQALQHRLADMHMAYLEACGLLRAWTEAIDDDAPTRRDALRQALPRVTTRAGRLVGQEAIQMHGGMGLTEELVISHCNARLQVTGSLLAPWIASGIHEDVREAT
ncbi:Acyl-CoA dehydrogenase [Variovorax sp. HW608]|uniref:acyl-CoA dehydrogenase family protein n=1 Tax=Variovorax sp. HW608 TaxID=1034889 RepID=UPI00081FF4CC|nr:acyl-CoA dehydrogenase family protein [Variovorax sp. HW608]SCK10624.1 Acyl-CoA dehydrogenase [Variovorax sp. HW608]